MKYTIQFVQTETDGSAENLVIKKIERLSRKFQEIINADIFFKEEKDTHGKGKICEIRLSLPGPRVFASSDEETYEAAVAETIRDLERQLAKKKGN